MHTMIMEIIKNTTDQATQCVAHLPFQCTYQMFNKRRLVLVDCFEQSHVYINHKFLEVTIEKL